ncbi:hypothetical protein ACOQFV_02475 [Nocardiopsis changdeensis]|uniref:Flp family type IVb pilin n=1 Tax=Nocardiopsis changdeensis TaxID=2831969 RepID=A0ABX8BVN9_9ACTN|nr:MULTISPECIES: hypothetical protein [Nocardiopsis]QUX26327.1 hypothetical protein KGD84_30050 [Nocardiopsis changdeensis]QYX40632.1 hypothetical protein K1J57_07430 [Nocardiopsis sp. MT53]
MEELVCRAHRRIRTWVASRQHVADDRGSASTEWLLTIMVAIAIATVVGGILVTEFTTAAESIDLGVTR